MYTTKQPNSTTLIARSTRRSDENQIRSCECFFIGVRFRVGRVHPASADDDDNDDELYHDRTSRILAD